MWTLVALCLLTAGPEVQISTLAGAREQGELISLTVDAVTVRTSNGERTIPSTDLLSLTPLNAPVAKFESQPTVWIDLIDGSQLLATSFTVTAGKANATLLGGETLEIPTRSIRSVRLQDQQSELARTSQLAKQWRDILAGEATGDLIIVRKITMAEEPAAAPASASLDQLEGVLGDISDDKVQFTYDEQQIPVARTKVEGVVYFHPAGRELPHPLCRLLDATGSSWSVKALTLAGEHLQLTTVSGVRAELPLARLRQFDYSAGKIVYLSDLEPETIKWTNFYGDTAASAGLAKMFAPRRDRSFSGGKINIAGQTYDKGLALHSRTLVEYRLQGKFNKFAALAALDDQVRATGNVKLVISLDGKSLGEFPISGKDTVPTAIDLDIRNGRKLSILVDFGTGLDISDRLHLANARVTQ